MVSLCVAERKDDICSQYDIVYLVPVIGSIIISGDLVKSEGNCGEAAEHGEHCMADCSA